MQAVNLPIIEVVAPPLPKRRYGLFSVASEISINRPGLVTFQQNCPGEINIAPDPCGTPQNKVTRTDEWHDGLLPFWAYTLTQCGAFGDAPDGTQFHEENIEYALEVALDEKLDDAGTTVETAADLEDFLAKAFAHLNSTIVLTPALAIEANDYLKGDGETLWVKATGQPVTVSPAYTIPGVVTGPVYVKDSNPETTAAMDHETNQRYQLVEGLYLVGASCEDGVIAFTIG